MDEKAVARVREFKERVRGDMPLEKLIFFGSRTKAKYGSDSDVDLIVVSKKFKGLNFFKRVAKMYDYWNLRYPVDFLCYTPEEFRKLRKGVTIVSEALKEGVII